MLKEMSIEWISHWSPHMFCALLGCHASYVHRNPRWKRHFHESSKQQCKSWTTPEHNCLQRVSSETFLPLRDEKVFVILKCPAVHDWRTFIMTNGIESKKSTKTRMQCRTGEYKFCWKTTQDLLWITLSISGSSYSRHELRQHVKPFWTVYHQKSSVHCTKAWDLLVTARGLRKLYRPAPHGPSTSKEPPKTVAQNINTLQKGLQSILLEATVKPSGNICDLKEGNLRANSFHKLKTSRRDR